MSERVCIFCRPEVFDAGRNQVPLVGLCDRHERLGLLVIVSALKGSSLYEDFVARSGLGGGPGVGAAESSRASVGASVGGE